MSKMCIFRRDTFRYPKLINAPGKCAALGRFDFGYEVRITCNEVKLLPPYDFIIDQGEIHEYFLKNYTRKRKPTMKSCEVIAQETLAHFVNLFTDANVPYAQTGAVLIEVEINPGPERGIRVMWERNN